MRGERGGMKTIASLALSLALAASIPAGAHTPTIHYAGYQIGYDLGAEDVPGSGGYVNAFGAAPTPVPGQAIVAEEGVMAIVNHDPVSHTFTECAAACDTSNGVPGALSPSIELAGSSSASETQLNSLNAALEAHRGETIILMCTVHRFMRAKLAVIG